MMIKQHIFFGFLVCIPLLFAGAQAHEVLINTQDGEMFVFEVDPQESLAELQDKVAALLDGRESSIVVEMSAKDSIKVLGFQMSRNQGGYLGYPRDYHAVATAAEKADIHYIVTYLANKSLIQIAFAKADLEAAGDRIDHIHPLRFLMTVFTNEELKVGIRNIRGKAWVWNHFIGGLKESLSTEMSIGNMQDEFIKDFAKTVKIDIKLIYPAIQRQNWDELIDALITHIPREGDHDRYDC